MVFVAGLAVMRGQVRACDQAHDRDRAGLTIPQSLLLRADGAIQ
jgi:hypothetical protein